MACQLCSLAWPDFTFHPGVKKSLYLFLIHGIISYHINRMLIYVVMLSAHVVELHLECSPALCHELEQCTNIPLHQIQSGIGGLSDLFFLWRAKNCLGTTLPTLSIQFAYPTFSKLPQNRLDQTFAVSNLASDYDVPTSYQAQPPPD